MKQFLTICRLVLLEIIMLSALGSCQILLNSFTPRDLTLERGSTGVDVVDATLLKIDSLSIPGGTLRNDFGLLRRIGLVESDFGNNPLVHQNGGIWQISPYITSFLSNIPSSVEGLVNAFGESFGNDTIDFENSDFTVPLNSAVAARVFIEIQLSLNFETNFPGSVAEQATWWATLYRNTSANATLFVDTVLSFERANQCNVSRMDLWFLIDGSGSIGADNFQTCLSFVDQTAAQFDIHPDNVRTGLMIYDGSTNLISLFNQHQSNEQFSTVVLASSYPDGSTATGAAISETARVGFNEDNGARPRSDGVPRVLVVLTDGQSQDSVEEASANIKEQGVTVFGVGVGSGFNADEVNEIASDPDSIYAFALTDFSDLAEVLQDAIADQSCSVSTIIPEGTNVSVANDPGLTTYLQVDLPANGSLELIFNVEITSSVGIVYASVTISNPGPAFYDAMFEITVGITIAYYNVDPISSESQRRKRQVELENGPTTLYLGIETIGSEPINLELTTTERDEIFVPPATTTEMTTSGSVTMKEMRMFPLIVLGVLLQWI